MQNYSYENDFDLHENETYCRTHFHMNGFALTLVLKQRLKKTRKWPIRAKERDLVQLMKLPQLGVLATSKNNKDEKSRK